MVPPAYAGRRLQVFQRTKANTQEIESLAPRVRALAGSLCTPIPGGDIKEGSRRKVLERYFHNFRHQKLSLTFGIVRKLEDIHRDLILLSEQGNVQGFFNNVKNADKLGGLIEDIHDAMMDYQVCTSYCSYLPCLMLA